MADARWIALGAVMAAAGGGTIGYGVTRAASTGMTPAATGAIEAAVAQLDGDIRAAQGALQGRAGTIAGILQVQVVVETDVATAKQDVATGELRFTPEPGEVVEIGRTPAGGELEVLTIQPEAAMHTEHAGKPGSYRELVGDHVAVTEIARVVPKYQPDKFSAYVAVTRSLDLQPAMQRLAAAHVGGRLEVDGKSLEIGAVPAGAESHVEKLPSVPGAQLVVAGPTQASGGRLPLIAGGAGGALIGLIVLVVGMIKRRATATAEAVAPTLSEPRSTAAPSAAVAAGTPAPVDVGIVPVPTDGLAPGALVGRWEVVRRLGSGGMADVYLARAKGEAGFQKLVAVKVMHPHLARNERAVEHFLDEARLAAQITHPNVVQIQDLGKIGNDYIIAMEYVDGVDLERLLTSARTAGRSVPIDVGLGILCRICDGLNGAHRAVATDGSPLHLVHRDVKAANVLVSKQGGVKVVDFGIAKAAQQGHLTLAGETKGTPSMMAPEQRVGEQVDVRADVYSVAAVGYEILTGQAVNLDLATLAHLGIEKWPHLPLPSSQRPPLPKELDEILMTAMSYDRKPRPADCAALEASLEAVMKRHNLTCSDKDIARWVQAELAHDLAAPLGAAPTEAPALR